MSNDDTAYLRNKSEGASDFAKLLLDAIGNKQELNRSIIADIYFDYIKRLMQEIETKISEAA